MIQIGWPDYTAAAAGFQCSVSVEAKKPETGWEYVLWHQYVTAGAGEASYLAPSVDNLLCCFLPCWEDASCVPAKQLLRGLVLGIMHVTCNLCLWNRASLLTYLMSINPLKTQGTYRMKVSCSVHALFLVHHDLAFIAPEFLLSQHKGRVSEWERERECFA